MLSFRVFTTARAVTGLVANAPSISCSLTSPVRSFSVVPCSKTGKYFNAKVTSHRFCHNVTKSEPLNILVFLGSTRDGRMGDRAAKFVMASLSKMKHKAELLDPLKLDLPMLKQPLHFHPDPKQAPKILHELNAKIEAADAFIVVTPEYNRHLPPALLNLMDYFPANSYAFKNSGIVAYSMGPSGGAVGGHNARTLLTELGCLPVSFNFLIPMIQTQLDENGKPTPEGTRMDSGIERLMTQLEWWASAAKLHRAKGGTPNPASF